jgi:hypothetical protein
MQLIPTPVDAAISPFGATGPGRVAGPGNQGQIINAPININNPIGHDHLQGMMNTATQAQVPRVRQGREAATRMTDTDAAVVLECLPDEVLPRAQKSVTDRRVADAVLRLHR